MEIDLAFELLFLSKKLQQNFSASQIWTSLNELWMPLFYSIKPKLAKFKPCIIGITGPPGVGKTSVATALCILIREYTKETTYTTSLEDFYYPPAVRISKGLKWRAVPGSHDTQRLNVVLNKIRNGDVIGSLPRYDMKNDCALVEEEVNAPIVNLVLEGWTLSTNLKGYEAIATYLDYLIYLDASKEDCKRWRLEREEKYRATGSGYDYHIMKSFWEEALEPGIVQWVMPQRKNAQTIVSFDNHHNVVRISTNASANNK